METTLSRVSFAVKINIFKITTTRAIVFQVGRNFRSVRTPLESEYTAHPVRSKYPRYEHRKTSSPQNRIKYLRVDDGRGGYRWVGGSVRYNASLSPADPILVSSRVMLTLCPLSASMFETNFAIKRVVRAR